MPLTASERFERVVFNGAGGFFLLAYALRSFADGRRWEAAGFAVIGVLYILATAVGRRPVNRTMTALLVAVHGAAFLVWLLATDLGWRIGGFAIAAAAYGLVNLLAWTDGVAVEPPAREEPITLNLSSR